MRQDGESILRKYLPSVAELPKSNDQLEEMLGTFKDIIHGGIKDQFLINRSKPDVSLFKKVRKCSKTFI